MPPPIRSPRINDEFTCYGLEIRPSKIHRFGVYAKQRIPANRKVIEYTGKRLTNAEADEVDGNGCTYLFELDDKWTLDGAIGGSGAEIINHSCAPNLITRIMKGHILYMSLRSIKKDEELTVDYCFSDPTDTTKCRCGAPNCRGTILKTEILKKAMAEKEALKKQKLADAQAKKAKTKKAKAKQARA